jgi:GTPase
MKFFSKPVSEHAEVPLADDGRLEQIVERWQQRAPRTSSATDRGNLCYLVSIHDRTDAVVQAAQLNELVGLVEAQGDTVVGTLVQLLRKKDPRTFIGAGIAERLAIHARAVGATMLVLDAELSPSQTRNLEDLTGLPICDREAVILNVFRHHASTKRARLQVEIAQLDYLRPRIRGIGLNMDQQMGGSNKARGPGETASELLARRIDQRLAELRRALTQLKLADTAQRKQRDPTTRVALVGYTNAGKTSLMNALTHAGLSVRNRPFETLDTTSRALTRHGGDVLLCDTVGFIRRLPERLFASFETTLAEVAEASLLLLVVDASDPEASQHLDTTIHMLEKLGADDVPRLLVFNKVDKFADSPRALEVLADGTPYHLVCARDETSVASLRQIILERARGSHVQCDVFVPYSQQSLLHTIYAHCRVVVANPQEDGTQFTIQGTPRHVHSVVRALEETIV